MGSLGRRFRGKFTRMKLNALRQLAARMDHDVVRRSLYSPIPTMPPASAESTAPRDPAGVRLDVDSQLRWVEAELAPFLAEFPSRRGFDLWNSWYQGADAALLYAMVRRLRPRRVLEVGAGHSTVAIAWACEVNAADGSAADHLSVDPDPRSPLPALVKHEPVDVRELPLERFLELESDDLLFIDTTHTVKRGSEVNHLVLDVLPRLRPGVVVQVHDIFLPYDYPRAWHERGVHLAEQYLIEAFLVGNAGYEVLLAVHAVARARPQELIALIPAMRAAGNLDPFGPSALWIRRTGDGGSAGASARGP